MHVDLAGVGHRGLDGGPRDLVEGDAERRLVLEAQRLLDVPGDGLALAVGVGRQEDAVGLVRLLLQLGEDVLGRAPALALAVLALDDDVGGHPAGLDIDAGDDLALFAAARQVADVAVARQHLEIAAQVFVDRLRLRGRLDDHEVLRELAPTRRGARLLGDGRAVLRRGRGRFATCRLRGGRFAVCLLLAWWHCLLLLPETRRGIAAPNQMPPEAHGLQPVNSRQDRSKHLLFLLPLCCVPDSIQSSTHAKSASHPYYTGARDVKPRGGFGHRCCRCK